VPVRDLRRAGRNHAGGPSGAELFELPLVAVNTALLLLSSITYGFAVITMRSRRQGPTLVWLAVTGLLGAGFVGIELHEFSNLIHQGNGPQRSAFLSAFFTLVRHPRPPRDLRARLVGHADDAGDKARAHRRQPAQADVPVDVLALPGRDLDRRILRSST
jgi:hypothetical protein